MKRLSRLLLAVVLLTSRSVWTHGLEVIGMPSQAILVDEVLRQQGGGEVEKLAKYVASTTVRVELEVLARDRTGQVILEPRDLLPATDTVFCSGTIAAKRRIVLAAHCFEGELAYGVFRYPVTIYFGANFDRAGESGLVRSMVDYAIQVEYVRSSHRGNDAAVIELDRDIPSGCYAATPVNSLEDLQDDASNLKVYLAGTGATRKGDRPDSMTRFAEVGIRNGIMSIRRDQDVLVTVPVSNSRRDRMASCGGDSGGQLFAVMRNEIRWVGTNVSGDCANWSVSTVMTADRLKALEQALTDKKPAIGE